MAPSFHCISSPDSWVSRKNDLYGSDDMSHLRQTRQGRKSNFDDGSGKGITGSTPLRVRTKQYHASQHYGRLLVVEDSESVGIVILRRYVYISQRCGNVLQSFPRFVKPACLAIMSAGQNLTPSVEQQRILSTPDVLLLGISIEQDAMEVHRNR
jgi:hypothetical protein